MCTVQDYLVLFQAQIGATPSTVSQAVSETKGLTAYQSYVDQLLQPLFIAEVKNQFHAWTEISSDTFILDVINNCHIELDQVPATNINRILPPSPFFRRTPGH